MPKFITIQNKNYLSYNNIQFMNYRNYFDNIYSPEMLEPTRTSMVQALKEKLIPYIENNESITRQEISNLEISPTVYSEDYLSIKACQDGVSVCIRKPGSAQTFTTRPIEYRILNTTGGIKTNWTDLVWDAYDKTGTTATNENYGQLITSATVLSINSGESIQYRNKTCKQWANLMPARGGILNFILRDMLNPMEM